MDLTMDNIAIGACIQDNHLLSVFLAPSSRPHRRRRFQWASVRSVASCSGCTSGNQSQRAHCHAGSLFAGSFELTGRRSQGRSQGHEQLNPADLNFGKRARPTSLGGKKIGRNRESPTTPQHTPHRDPEAINCPTLRRPSCTIRKEFQLGAISSSDFVIVAFTMLSRSLRLRSRAVGALGSAPLKSNAYVNSHHHR